LVDPLHQYLAGLGHHGSEPSVGPGARRGAEQVVHGMFPVSGVQCGLGSGAQALDHFSLDHDFLFQSRGPRIIPDGPLQKPLTDRKLTIGHLLPGQLHDLGRAGDVVLPVDHGRGGRCPQWGDFGQVAGQPNGLVAIGVTLFKLARVEVRASPRYQSSGDPAAEILPTPVSPQWGRLDKFAGFVEPAIVQGTLGLFDSEDQHGKGSAGSVLKDWSGEYTTILRVAVTPLPG
jgi:hypothetical protein